MNTKIIFAVAALSVVALAGIALAHPEWNIADLTDEQKSFQLNMLEESQSMISDRIAYLNGELTDEEFESRLEAHHEAMQELQENSGFGPEGGCPMHGGGFGMYGHGGMGRGHMMGYGAGY